MENHTPTPWISKLSTIYHGPTEDDIVTSCIHRADAAFIVRAVNSYKEMLAALRSVRNEFRAYVLNDPKNLETALGSQILAQIDRAIAEAEGKESAHV